MRLQSLLLSPNVLKKVEFWDTFISSYLSVLFIALLIEKEISWA